MIFYVVEASLGVVIKIIKAVVLSRFDGERHQLPKVVASCSSVAESERSRHPSADDPPRCS